MKILNKNIAPVPVYYFHVHLNFSLQEYFVLFKFTQSFSWVVQDLSSTGTSCKFLYFSKILCFDSKTISWQLYLWENVPKSFILHNELIETQTIFCLVLLNPCPGTASKGIFRWACGIDIRVYSWWIDQELKLPFTIHPSILCSEIQSLFQSLPVRAIWQIK